MELERTHTALCNAGKCPAVTSPEEKFLLATITTVRTNLETGRTFTDVYETSANNLMSLREKGTGYTETEVTEGRFTRIVKTTVVSESQSWDSSYWKTNRKNLTFCGKHANPLTGLCDDHIEKYTLEGWKKTLKDAEKQLEEAQKIIEKYKPRVELFYELYPKREKQPDEYLIKFGSAQPTKATQDKLEAREILAEDLVASFKHFQEETFSSWSRSPPPLPAVMKKMSQDFPTEFNFLMQNDWHKLPYEAKELAFENLTLFDLATLAISLGNEYSKKFVSTRVTKVLFNGKPLDRESAGPYGVESDEKEK